MIDIKECVIDLSYEDKKFRFKYPQKMPLTIPLTTSFHRDKQIIMLTIMITVGQKYKKVAKGEINIYKKYFIGDNMTTDKWVYLTLYQTQLENMGHNTDIIKAELNKGKIYMTLNLLQPISEYKDIAAVKEPIQSNKTERYRSVVENSNEFLKKIKGKKANEIMEDLYEDINKSSEFSDGLSDLSISIIDMDEDKEGELDIRELVNDDYLAGLRGLIERGDVLPDDVDKLKQLNEVLLTKYNELSKMYNETLCEYKAQNEELRQKAKKLYEEYKQIKKEVYKGRVALKKKKEELKKEIATNSESNKKVGGDIANIKTELRYFKNEMGLEKGNDNEVKENSDITVLSNVLKKVHNLGYDIFSGSGLTADEKIKLKHLLNLEENEENNDAEFGDINDNIEEGNKIVGLIENDVNDLYLKKKIINVKIDQLDAFTYNFEDQTKVEEVTLKIVNEALVTSTGMTFTDWLLEHFGTK